MKEVSIKHTTHYRFNTKVALGPHLIRLQPSQNLNSQIFDYTLVITPAGYHARKQVDAFGNSITRLVFLEKVDFLKVQVEFFARLIPYNPFDFLIELHAEYYPFSYEKEQAENLWLYLKVHDLNIVNLWLSNLGIHTKGKTLDFVIAINKMVFEQFNYHLRHEHGVQSPGETINQKSGSCRDFSWLSINIYRSKGIAARFVSGYLVDLNFDDDAKDELVFHAWVEVFIPGAGWLGLDPTSGLLVNEFYIPLCSVPHFKEAAPITGNTEKCEVKMSFQSSVVRHFETL